MKRISFYKPSTGTAECKAACKVIKSGAMSQGKEVEKFEKAFAEYVGSKYAVAVDSCTSALFLCLYISEAQEVTIPTLTFCSVANSILQAVKDLKFEDVSYVGSQYALKGTRIIDSAHSLYRGCYIDGMMCFSFYPTKLLSSAEGGMIALNDEEAAFKLRLLRFHGKQGDNADYKVIVPGYKMNMTNLQAAIGLQQLKKLDKMNERRSKIKELYNKLLGESYSTINDLHLYRINIENRDAFRKYLLSKGIETSIHFKTPLHKQPAYAKYATGEYPSSEREADTTVSLPFYPDLTDKQVEYIAGKVNEWKS
jgi:perosamine synthetase